MTTQSFYVCHCGNTNDPHNFRHEFQEVARVSIRNGGFEMNANDFQKLDKSICVHCALERDCHGSIVEHSYKEVKFTYRHIRFSLPLSTKCIVCQKDLAGHSTKMNDHHFTVKFNVKNKQPQDVVEVINPEDDETKIILVQ